MSAMWPNLSRGVWFSRYGLRLFRRTDNVMAVADHKGTSVGDRPADSLIELGRADRFHQEMIRARLERRSDDIGARRIAQNQRRHESARIIHRRTELAHEGDAVHRLHFLFDNREP